MFETNNTDNQSAATVSLASACSETYLLIQGVEAALGELIEIDDDIRFAQRFVLAVIAANLDQNTDPTWGIVVAPPSSAKTEILTACAKLESVVPLSDLTANTLASGAQTLGGGEPSLLHKINGKILVLKDLTTILSMQRERRSEIVAQLREIYDGSLSKAFGTGKKFDWKGRIGFLAAVTEVIDSHHAVLSSLGERFVYFRFRSVSGSRAAAACKALRMSGAGTRARQALQHSIAALMSKVDTSLVEREPSAPLVNAFAAIADFTARARTPVHRDGYSREIVAALGAEGPGRLAKQLWNLARGYAAIRGARTVDEDDVAQTRRVAADSIPPLRWELLRHLGEALPNEILVQALFEKESLKRFGRTTRDRCLEELECLGLVDYFQATVGVNQDGTAKKEKAVVLSPQTQAIWKAAFGGPLHVSEQRPQVSPDNSGNGVTGNPGGNGSPLLGTPSANPQAPFFPDTPFFSDPPPMEGE